MVVDVATFVRFVVVIAGALFFLYYIYFFSNIVKSVPTLLVEFLVFSPRACVDKQHLSFLLKKSLIVRIIILILRENCFMVHCKGFGLNSDNLEGATSKHVRKSVTRYVYFKYFLSSGLLDIDLSLFVITKHCQAVEKTRFACNKFLCIHDSYQVPHNLIVHN